ncbi:MAG TPA: hypothetical protein VFI47_04560 [Acidimicrobiales bacterium]|nr:hypothetical protein [Acidimicrobiales bacterium]
MSARSSLSISKATNRSRPTRRSATAEPHVTVHVSGLDYCATAVTDLPGGDVVTIRLGVVSIHEPLDVVRRDVVDVERALERIASEAGARGTCRGVARAC